MEYTLVSFVNLFGIFPAFMEPIFQKGDQYFIQIRDVQSKGFSHLHEIDYEFMQFRKLTIKITGRQEQVDPATCLIHAFALSPNEFFWGTMKEIYPKLTEVKSKNPDNERLIEKINNYINEFKPKVSTDKVVRSNGINDLFDIPPGHLCTRNGGCPFRRNVPNMYVDFDAIGIMMGKKLPVVACDYLKTNTMTLAMEGKDFLAWLLYDDCKICDINMGSYED